MCISIIEMHLGFTVFVSVDCGEFFSGNIISGLLLELLTRSKSAFVRVNTLEWTRNLIRFHWDKYRRFFFEQCGLVSSRCICVLPFSFRSTVESLSWKYYLSILVEVNTIDPFPKENHHHSWDKATFWIFIKSFRFTRTGDVCRVETVLTHIWIVNVLKFSVYPCFSSL